MEEEKLMDRNHNHQDIFIEFVEYI